MENEFLHGDLAEEYMALSPGFRASNAEGKVCILRKTLYSLKQSPHSWFERFRFVMMCYGYRQDQADQTLF